MDILWTLNWIPFFFHFLDGLMCVCYKLNRVVWEEGDDKNKWGLWRTFYLLFCSLGLFLLWRVFPKKLRSFSLITYNVSLSNFAFSAPREHPPDPICTFSHPKYASITRKSLEMLFYEPSRDFTSKNGILFMFGYFLLFFLCILCVFVFSSLLLMRDRKNDFYCSFICWRKKLCCAG